MPLSRCNEEYPPVIEEIAKLTKELSKTVKESEKITEAIDAQREAHETSLKDIESQVAANSGLADEIRRLAAEE